MSISSCLVICPALLSFFKKSSPSATKEASGVYARCGVQESLLKFYEFGDHCEARLQISYPRIPFRLELLNGLVKVSSGGSDLPINENCTLLQITPDVAIVPSQSAPT